MKFDALTYREPIFFHPLKDQNCHGVKKKAAGPDPESQKKSTKEGRPDLSFKPFCFKLHVCTHLPPMFLFDSSSLAEITEKFNNPRQFLQPSVRCTPALKKKKNEKKEKKGGCIALPLFIPKLPITTGGSQHPVFTTDRKPSVYTFAAMCVQICRHMCTHLPPCVYRFAA